ncbi:hypothetical protein AURDEDRAFT_163569 [Auricularia subglabra TFB-10046 SS5]|nr:hypothetical protein AURDEDRAFT_163569 [Auricularia subglabra TFB-10046 SS5]
MATIGPILALLSQLDFSSSPQPPTVDVGMEQDLLHGRIFCHPPPQAQQAVTGTTIQQSILHDPPFFLQPPSQPQKFGLGVQHGSQEQQRASSTPKTAKAATKASPRSATTRGDKGSAARNDAKASTSAMANRAGGSASPPKGKRAAAGAPEGSTVPAKKKARAE